MQSGISASKELLDAFNDLVSNPRRFGLLATITGESLQPSAILEPASGDFSKDLGLLSPHLKPNEAVYAILRRYPAAPTLVGVTYVPDAAKVRQKMLFASSRLSLVRELGSEHFRETIFATTPEELTAAGFAKHDKHAAQDAPLTEEERTLGEVKRAEGEAGAGTGAKEIHLSKNFNMPLSEDALAAMKDIARDGGRTFFMLKINPETERIELVPGSSSPTTIPEMTRAISDTEPRFTFFRYTHTHNGTEQSPVLFFYTCPLTPGNKAIKNRMLYPLMKRAVVTVAEQEAGLNLDKKRWEVEEPAEITEAMVLGDLHPKVETTQRFSRPKRPGR